LDLMVQVDASGDKAIDEESGGADSTSDAVDFNNITALLPYVNDVCGNRQILVSTDAPAASVVIINRNSTIFDEPTFFRSALLPTNAINSFSFVNVLGDTALIDAAGVRSFNGAQQINVASRDNIFNLKISRAFENIVQNPNSCCAINFDGYALFS